jgi:hypothetical protein
MCRLYKLVAILFVILIHFRSSSLRLGYLNLVREVRDPCLLVRILSRTALMTLPVLSSSSQNFSPLIPMYRPQGAALRARRIDISSGLNPASLAYRTMHAFHSHSHD